MIRRAEKTDFDAISEIWRVCFGDGPEYLDFFFERMFRYDRCLLDWEDGQAVAMVHLLPVDCSNPAQRLPGGYIFAAATLPEYRGRGIMGRLLDEAHRQSRNEGLAFTSLLPAEDGLYEYYSRFGYQEVLYLERVELTRAELESRCGLPAALQPGCDAAHLLNLRTRRFSPAILWERDMFSAILDEWKLTGGRILTEKDGYCLWKKAGDTAFVKELCADEISFLEIASELLRQTEASRFAFHLPAGQKLLPKGNLFRCGMLRETGNSKTMLGRAYFNMMMDG